MTDITKLDGNLQVSASFGRDDIVFFSPNEAPFSLYGVFYENGCYRRMPEPAAKCVSDGVRELSAYTAGGRVCFATDSDFVAISCRRPGLWLMPHMALAGSGGFDLYVREAGKTAYYGTFMPDPKKKEGYDSILSFPTKKMRELVIHFPLYCGITSLAVGLERGAALRAWDGYRIRKPVVFYGSSITEGACASTPGNDYIGRLSRRFGFDYVNLGFSGNAKGESSMMAYIVGLDMSAFVYDYDYNAPDAAHLAATHYAGYRAVRAAHPELPIVMASRPNFDYSREDGGARRDIIAASYERAVAEGDTHVYFVDGAQEYRTFVADGCTVDGCHPNDLGFFRMAEAFGTVMEEIFGKP